MLLLFAVALFEILFGHARFIWDRRVLLQNQVLGWVIVNRGTADNVLAKATHDDAQIFGAAVSLLHDLFDFLVRTIDACFHSLFDILVRWKLGRHAATLRKRISNPPTYCVSTYAESFSPFQRF